MPVSCSCRSAVELAGAMGVLPRFIWLLVIIAAAAGAVGHVAAAAGAEEAMPVRPLAAAAVVGKVVAVPQGAGTTTTLCCSNMTGYHECVEACFDYYPREQAVQICDPGCQEAYQCRTVSGDECPSGSGHPSSSDDDRRLTNSVAAGGDAQLAADGTLCCSK
ncbi:hypothetical protein BS78_10G116600 [Paspalum vaginatum]|nr:hypothetical protein BS78_10G116600 [Paspalum vaginatum]